MEFSNFDLTFHTAVVEKQRDLLRDKNQFMQLNFSSPNVTQNTFVDQDNDNGELALKLTETDAEEDNAELRLELANMRIINDELYGENAELQREKKMLRVDLVNARDDLEALKSRNVLVELTEKDSKEIVQNQRHRNMTLKDEIQKKDDQIKSLSKLKNILKDRLRNSEKKRGLTERIWKEKYDRLKKLYTDGCNHTDFGSDALKLSEELASLRSDLCRVTMNNERLHAELKIYIDTCTKLMSNHRLYEELLRERTEEQAAESQSRLAFDIYELARTELTQVLEVLSQSDSLRESLISYFNNSELLKSIEKLTGIYKEYKRAMGDLRCELLLKNGELEALRKRLELNQKKCSNLLADNAFLKAGSNEQREERDLMLFRSLDLDLRPAGYREVKSEEEEEDLLGEDLFEDGLYKSLPTDILSTDKSENHAKTVKKLVTLPPRAPTKFDRKFSLNARAADNATNADFSSLSNENSLLSNCENCAVVLSCFEQELG